MPMLIVVQAILFGFFIGSMYALWSFGLSLVWGVMKIINVAQGHLILLSAYISYWLWILYGFDPIMSLVLVFPFLFSIGVFLFWLLLKPVFNKPGLLSSSMLITWGLAIIIENSILFFWSATARSANTFYVGTPICLGSITLPFIGIVAFIFAVGLLIGLIVFLKKTFLGKAVRAVAQSVDGAKLVGINVFRISALAFGIAIASTAVAGVAVSITYMFHPSLAWNWIGRIFVVCVIGGLGNIWGIIFAGLMLGVVESLVTVFCGAQWAPFVAYVILIAILILRPHGLFGET